MGDATQAAARGRRRSETARKAILRAAYDLLASDGYRALTFEAVAARAGVGRPTIYRWWPGKAALAVDALLSETPWNITTIAVTASAAADMRSALHRIVKGMSGTYGKVLAAVLSGARDEPDVLEMYKEKISGPRRKMGLDCLRRGIETGEFRPDVDLDAALDAMILPIFFKLLIGAGSLNAAWIDRLTDFVLDAIEAAPVKDRPIKAAKPAARRRARIPSRRARRVSAKT